MNKILGILLGLIALAAIVIGAFYALNGFIYDEKQAKGAADYKDAEYVIENDRIRLADGVAETEPVTDAASKTITRYFGNELKTDLDGDGREDAVFLLTQETGGSGLFYYVVAAINTERGYVGGQALYLGDRIAPQSTNKGSGRSVVVSYAERAPNEPFSTPPSVGKSITLIFDSVNMQFGEVVTDFEGEADPSRMTLGMNTWNWISAQYNDGRELKPGTGKKFTLTFAPGGRFSATTDCNSMAGSYTAATGTIAFSDIISTKMFCEGSQEGEFATLLQNASGYHFTSRGELILDLKFDSGSVIFR